MPEVDTRKTFLVNFFRFRISSICIALNFGMIVIYYISRFSKYRYFYFYTAAAFLLIVFLSINTDCGKKIIYIALRSKLLAAMFFWLLLSTLWSILPFTTLFKAMSSGIYFIVYYIFCYTVLSCSTTSIRFIYKLILCYIIIINCILLVKFGTIRPETNKITSFLQQTNDLSLYIAENDGGHSIGSYSNEMVSMLGALLPFLFYCYIFEDKRKKVNLILLFLTLMSLLASESRSAYVIIIFSVFFVGIFYYKNTLQKLRLIIVCTSVFLILIIGLYSIPPTKKFVIVPMRRFLNANIASDSEVNFEAVLGNRVLVFQECLEIISEYPLLGMGMGTFKPFMESKHGEGQRIIHNVVLNLWTGAGFMPVLIFVCLCIKALFRLWKKYKSMLLWDQKESYWYLSNFLMLCIFLLHGQIRPQLNNPLLYFPISISLMSQLGVMRPYFSKRF